MATVSFEQIYVNFGEMIPQGKKKPFEGQEMRKVQLGATSEATKLSKKVEDTTKEIAVTKFNGDLALIPTVHPQYLFGVTESSKYQQSLEDKHKDTAKRDVKARPGGNVFCENIVLLAKQIAFAKAFFLQAQEGTGYHATAEKRNNHKLVLCFGGHWVDKNDLQGEHVFPSSIIWERLRKLSLKFFPDSLKTKDSKGKKNVLNRIAWEVHLFDSRNIVGMCGNCNKEKGEGLPFTWFLRSDFYGEDFVKSITPLSEDIIPRTKDGIGLGDAMVSYFFMKRDSVALLATVRLTDDTISEELTRLVEMKNVDLDRMLARKETREEAQVLMKVAGQVFRKLKRSLKDKS